MAAFHRLWPRPCPDTFLGCQDFCGLTLGCGPTSREAPGEADRKGPWVLQAGEALDEAASACQVRLWEQGGREAPLPGRPRSQGLVDKEMAHARWLPRQVVDEAWVAGIQSALHVVGVYACVVEAFQVLFCVLSVNHSLMVVPPDPWICTPATPFPFAGTGLESLLPTASQEQPFTQDALLKYGLLPKGPV